jgi:hypothetical protein
MRCVGTPGGTIPPLQKGEANPLESIHAHCHLSGKRSPIALQEARMPVYCAYIVGLHDRTIGVVQLDCRDDESAIQSARRLVDSHPVEVWQTDRPVARLDALSKQTCKT